MLNKFITIKNMIIVDIIVVFERMIKNESFLLSIFYALHFISRDAIRWPADALA